MTAPVLNTPLTIIKLAMQNAGLIQDTDTPDPSQLASYSGRLIGLIKLWQTQGLKLWLDVDTAIPLVAGQRDYVLSPTGDVVMAKPMRVLQAYYLYTASGVQRPITALSWNEWLLLSQRTQQGTVSQYFVNKQATNLTVSFWLVPDSTEASSGMAHLLLQTQVATFINLTEQMNFPEEWFIALHWGLADEICTGQPDAIVQRCKTRADTFRTALEDWDVEDTNTYFQVDMTRMNQNAGRFR